MVGGAAEGVSRRLERTGTGGHPIRRRAKRHRVGTTAIRGQPAQAPVVLELYSHGRYPRVLPKAEGETLPVHPAAAAVGSCLADLRLRPGWRLAAPLTRRGLPAPTLTVINPENGHLVFELAVPVLLGPRNK